MSATNIPSVQPRVARGMDLRTGLRRVGAAARSFGAWWSELVERGQLGPDPDRSLSRHLGSRI